MTEGRGGSRNGTLPSGVVLVGILGLFVGAHAGLVSYVLGGEVGFFAVELSGPGRALGVVAALAVGPALLAGPLAYGWLRSSRTLLVVALVAAVGISAGTFLGLQQIR